MCCLWQHPTVHVASIIIFSHAGNTRLDGKLVNQNSLSKDRCCGFCSWFLKLQRHTKNGKESILYFMRHSSGPGRHSSLSIKNAVNFLKIRFNVMCAFSFVEPQITQIFLLAPRQSDMKKKMMKWKITVIYWLSEGKGAREVYHKSKTQRKSNSFHLQLKPTFKSWNYAALADWAELIYRHLINSTGESPLLLLCEYNIYIDNYKTNLKYIKGDLGGYSIAHSLWDSTWPIWDRENWPTVQPELYLRPQWRGNKDEGEKEMRQDSFSLFSKKGPVFFLPSWLKVSEGQPRKCHL